MKSDWDDAPQRLRKDKRSGEIVKWTFAGLIGCSITLALLFFMNDNLSLHLFGKSKQDAVTDTYPDFKPLEEIQPPIKTAEEIFWESVAADKQKKKEEEERKAKQTEFNAQNYQPQNPINTYSPPQYQQAAAESRSTRSRQSTRDQTKKWIKSWNGGTNYLAEWVAINNYIDNTSVCANHKRGSIDYRECRKAAKQHFHEECRSWRARYDNDRKAHSDRMKTRFCSAASSFNPMG